MDPVQQFLGLTALLLASFCAQDLAQLRSEEPRPGDLLIAGTALSDPNFAESVVLLLEAGPEGAGGVILNRPMPIQVSTVMPQIEELEGRSDVLHWGGPVEPGASLMLVRRGSEPSEGLKVLEGVYVVRSTESLRQLLLLGIPENDLRVFGGYAGWSPGQLEWEIANGGWRLRRASARWIFDVEPSELWEKLLKLARSPVV